VGFRKLSFGGIEALVWVDERISRRLSGLAARPALGLLRLLARGRASLEVSGPCNGSSVPLTLDENLKPFVPQINAIEWYHTIEIADGWVTNGAFDLRPYLPLYKLPESLAGQRVLDVASFDGFWAFEFERRGAQEVVAMDIENFGSVDYPPKIRAAMSPDQLEGRRTKEGFELIRQIRNSKVQLQYCNVYDLSPEKLGKFDFVFSSDLLLHLRDPVKALQNIYRVTSGCAYIVDCFQPGLPGKTVHYEGGRRMSTWWAYGYRALEEMIFDAGFSKVEPLHKFRTGGRGQRPWIWHAAFRATP
jgi:tRNA (mo5U34)-methyltransferase